MWVREAFGDRTGFQATWFVFMKSAYLYPSLLSFGAAALATAFGRPDLACNGLYVGFVVLAGFWLATAVVSRGMKTTAGLSNLGVGLGTVVPALALIFFMFAWLIDSKPSATPLGLSDVVPPFDGLPSIALVVGTFVAFAGLEVNAVHIKHLKGRPRSYFKAVDQNGGRDRLRDVHARLDRDLGRGTGRDPGLTLAHPRPLPSTRMGSGSPVCPTSCPGCWSSGLSRPPSPGSRGRAGACGWWVAPATCPRCSSGTNKNDVQMPILLFQGVIVTILALIFVVAPNTSAAFALLQDISIILYMCMYVCMFAAAIRLRRSQPDVARPIRDRWTSDHGLIGPWPRSPRSCSG